MRYFLVTSALLVLANASLSQFQAYKARHGKTYLNQAEETKRFAIFKDNLQAIEQHNKLYDRGLVKYKKGVNQFTDWSAEEFQSFLTLQRKPVLNSTTTEYVKTGVDLPEAVDWRNVQVTDVKNQGKCGSCWSFSITGSTEAAYYRKNNRLVSLSEQQLIDCTTDINVGCHGGFLNPTFPYVQRKGLQSEETYPYTGTDDPCLYNTSKVIARISSFVSLPFKDEAALLEAVGTVGPISVGVDASYLSAYETGIFENALCTDQLNHGVVVVGYGSDNGTDYWIVKNSWGIDWGENGYFRLLRGRNECGIADDDIYPIID